MALSTRSLRPAGETCPYAQHALYMWPQLDRRVLGRPGCDPRRIAVHVARRTSLSVDVIVEILERSVWAEREESFYFG